MGRERLRDRSAIGVLAVVLSIGVMLALTACSAPTASTSAGESTTMGYAGRASGGAPAPTVAPLEAPNAGVGKDAAAGVGQDASTIAADARLIVRNKTMRIEVAAVSAAIDKLRAMASRDGADITQMQVATSSDTPVYPPVPLDGAASSSSAALQAYLTIRVPAAKYQAFIDEAAKLGKVLVQSETTDDVTQQHVDLSARLENLRAEEASLRTFFAKAKNVSDMLQIEQQLSRVRGEIESMAAQVAYLERQAAMATVTIELAEPKPLVRPAGIDWGVGAAFTDSIRAFVGTVNVLIVMLGPILALAIFVGLPALLIARLVWRAVRRRRAARGVAAENASGAATLPDATSRP